MECANINAKNIRKVIVSTHNKNKTMLISCDDKLAVKFAAPGNPLALVPKSKVGLTDDNSEHRVADHAAFFKSNTVPTACLLIDFTDDFDLGFRIFYKG